MAVNQRGTKKNSWYVTITINGKRIRKVIPEATTKRQAERAERAIRNELFEKRYGDGGFRLFGDFVEKSYKPYAREHKKGYYVELTPLKALIERFGKLRLSDITPEDVNKFKTDRANEITSRKKLRSKATVNRDVAVLSAIFNLAKDYGEVKENPVNKIKYYGNLPTRDRILSEDEEIILFEKIRDNVKFSRQIEILLYTGMRRGELFKIEWRDIDLTNGFINIRKEITKTNKGRIIPMLSNVRAIFESLFNEAAEILLNDKIFPGTDSQAGAFSENFRLICKELNFEDLTVHSLRHTFSTRADECKVGAFAQKALLGHSRLAMTDRYTHPSKETLKENIVGMERYLARTRREVK
ncbi:MAG: tyrosine-type recombinase/integrase [Pyrinomonadaceae bacterium]